MNSPRGDTATAATPTKRDLTLMDLGAAAASAFGDVTTLGGSARLNRHGTGSRSSNGVHRVSGFSRLNDPTTSALASGVKAASETSSAQRTTPYRTS